MPLIKSAIKRMRQTGKRDKRLRPYRTQMKTSIRSVVDLVKAGKNADAQKKLPEVFKAIDTAAKKGIIHAKNAARKKSFVSKLVAAK